MLRHILLLVIASIGLAMPTHGAQEVVAGEFGDWTKICTTEEGKAVCRIAQDATQGESGKRLFRTMVGLVDDNPQPVLYMIAPLGIYLPHGLSLKLSEEDLVSAVVQRCDNSGCLAVVGLPDEFISKMKAGAQGQLLFGVNAQQLMPIPLSLKGFTRGFDSLSSVTQEEQNSSP